MIEDRIKDLSDFDKVRLYQEALEYEESGITDDTLLRQIAESESNSSTIITMIFIVSRIYKHFAIKYFT